MKHICSIIFAMLTLSSCNYSIWVKKDKVVKSSFGFMLFGTQEESHMIMDFFIPVEKLDTSRDYLSDFLIQKKKVGFFINIERQYRMRLMSISDSLYNDLYEKNHREPLSDFNRRTIGSLYLLPVEVNYIDIYPKNDMYRIDTTFIFKGYKVTFKLSPHRRIRQLDVYPLKWDK